MVNLYGVASDRASLSAVPNRGEGSVEMNLLLKSSLIEI